MPSERRRATIADVAREAGVSSATAGRALGDYGYVRAEIRERVQKAAEKLGYRPNGLARSMITGRTNTIGVVGADVANPFFAAAMRGIGDVAREKGFGTILTNSDEDVLLEREAVRLLLEKQVDGIIVAPADTARAEHLFDAVEKGTPVVVFDRAVPDLPADSVLADSVEGTRTAVRHLIDKGHRRIAIIAELGGTHDVEWPRWLEAARLPEPARLMPSGARLVGYLLAHREAGLQPDRALIRATGAYDVGTARAQTLAALALANPPTALFTADNVMTYGAFQAVSEAKVSIPDDISFVAYDDMDWMTFVRPAITAVSQPVYQMGMAAAQMLIARLGDPARPFLPQAFETTLIERGSVKDLVHRS